MHVCVCAWWRIMSFWVPSILNNLPFWGVWNLKSLRMSSFDKRRTFEGWISVKSGPECWPHQTRSCSQVYFSDVIPFWNCKYLTRNWIMRIRKCVCDMWVSAQLLIVYAFENCSLRFGQKKTVRSVWSFVAKWVCGGSKIRCPRCEGGMVNGMPRALCVWQMINYTTGRGVFLCWFVNICLSACCWTIQSVTAKKPQSHC